MMMTTRRLIAGALPACGVALLVAGCSGWGYDPPVPGEAVTHGYNLAALRSAAPTAPQTFDQALTRDYASFASSLQDDQGDWKDVDYFSRKGLAASRGELVPPENNGNWLVPLEVPEQFRSELTDGRSRLVAALNGGAPTSQPVVAARAQASYDCWVERMEDDWQSAVKGPCRQQFMAALHQLEQRAAAKPAATGPGGSRELRVYFNFDKADLTPEGRRLLKGVADRAKQDTSMKVVVIGKADRAGSDAYNLALSQRRADAVRQVLVQNGVPDSQVETRWVGEREPPVPTAAGVREPRNRVVEIAEQP
jgi:OOP family OmpA-OmpF porin